MRHIVKRLVEPAVVHRYRLSDERDAGGNRTTVYDDDPTPTKGWVDMRGRITAASETVGDTDWQIETVDIYLRPDPTITGRDQVTIRGARYEILGPSHTFTHPRKMRQAYTHAIGKKVT